jgi:hypothetical protein
MAPDRDREQLGESGDERLDKSLTREGAAAPVPFGSSEVGSGGCVGAG